MQTGPYIAERLLPKVVSQYCQQNGISFHAFSDEWVLRLERGASVRWIVGYKFDVNYSASGELVQDKVAAYDALAATHVPAIEHLLVRSVPHESVHTEALLAALAGKPVVSKPLAGTAGREVHYFDSAQSALAHITNSSEPAWALSPHYDIMSEYRFVMLNGQTLLAFTKTRPTYRGKLKLFNLGHGAVAEEIVDAEKQTRLEAIALAAMRATALRLAAVDIVELNDGSLRVLEINDGISLEHYARQSAANKNRAEHVYGTIIATLFN